MSDEMSAAARKANKEVDEGLAKMCAFLYRVQCLDADRAVLWDEVWSSGLSSFSFSGSLYKRAAFVLMIEEGYLQSAEGRVSWAWKLLGKEESLGVFLTDKGRAIGSSGVPSGDLKLAG